MISRLSDGGMRDALSLLDRCIAVSRDVTEDTVRSCAGVILSTIGLRIRWRQRL